MLIVPYLEGHKQANRNTKEYINLLQKWFFIFPIFENECWSQFFQSVSCLVCMVDKRANVEKNFNGYYHANNKSMSQFLINIFLKDSFFTQNSLLNRSIECMYPWVNTRWQDFKACKCCYQTLHERNKITFTRLRNVVCLQKSKM